MLLKVVAELLFFTAKVVPDTAPTNEVATLLFDELIRAKAGAAAFHPNMHSLTMLTFATGSQLTI